MTNLQKTLISFSEKLASGAIVWYQKVLSPDHGVFRVAFGMNRCRFFPTCSEYTLAALRQYGLFRGAVVSFRRILRCGPWSLGGYDPVRQATGDTR